MTALFPLSAVQLSCQAMNAAYGAYCALQVVDLAIRRILNIIFTKVALLLLLRNAKEKKCE